MGLAFSRSELKVYLGSGVSVLGRVGRLKCMEFRVLPLRGGLRSVAPSWRSGQQKRCSVAYDSVSEHEAA